jgi:succinoglycan biosynthesis protein ExoM
MIGDMSSAARLGASMSAGGIQEDSLHARLLAICIVTYQRPEGLRRLLDTICEQQYEAEPPPMEIVIIDNDKAGSARTIVEGWSASCGPPVHYEIEPRRGIPFARNAAVAYAAPRADFIVFVDDDEAPTQHWLEALLQTQREYDADVVAGPVESILPPDAPAWVERGRHFDHPTYEDGSLITMAASGNVLVRSDVFLRLEKHFDERLAYSGGSDSHFFRRVNLAGLKMVWSADALVREWVPASRATAAWLVRRFYRHGTTLSHRELDLLPPWRAIPGLLWRAKLHIMAGTLLLPIGLLRGKHAWVMYLRYLAYGMGIIGGIFGGRVEEYRETHGR